MWIEGNDIWNVHNQKNAVVKKICRKDVLNNPTKYILVLKNLVLSI